MKRVMHGLERARPWRGLAGGEAQVERVVVWAEDGSELVMRHLAPTGPPRQVPPVMLLHGLGANHHTYLFEERSLARWLADHGYDVWMPNLRGHGKSAPANFQWGIDEYLTQDLPAVIAAILERTGHDTLQWVGHSMGGVLLMCYGSLHADAPIARGVTIASAMDYRVGASGFANLQAMRAVLEPLLTTFELVPFGAAMHLLSPLLGRPPYLLERFNMWPLNIEPQLMRRIYARCFHGIPASLLLSLASTFEESGFRMRDGYSLLNNVAGFAAPLLMLAASRDAQVSPQAVEHTCELIGENARVVHFGKELGHEQEYGHFDLILGRQAPREVWPVLDAFLGGA